MKKRGLSGVVTVILIILLVLVAIGIIWAAIRPPIQETGERVSGDCLTLDVEALACNTNGDGSYNITFTRNPGAGSLSDVKLIFYEAGGQTDVTSYVTDHAGSALTELETGRVNGYNPGFIASEFNVASVIQPGETEITCEITNEPISC